MNFPKTKIEYDLLKQRLESKGFTVLTPYRKGLKKIRLGDMVLSGGDKDD